MKAINKNILREIAKTKNRFFSIFTICAIGVGFFSGVRAAPNDMTVSADEYYDSHRLFDLRVLSTFGMTEADAETIAEVEGVSEVYTSKYTDLSMRCGDDKYLTRVYSWNNNEVNIVDLKDGRFPEKENECIVSYNMLRDGIKVGDVVTMTDLTDAEEYPLINSEYTVVGIYETPMFISQTQRGSTTIGNGSLDAFAYITESNFIQDVYTEIYVKSDELTAMQSYSDEYEELCGRLSEKLEELGKERSEIRYDEVIGEALREIEDGEEELAEAKTEGQQELEDAKAELADAERQIAEGEKELEDAKQEIDDGEAQLADAEAQLLEAQKELDSGLKELQDNEKLLYSAEQELTDAKAELDSAKAELEAGKAELDESLKQLDEGQAEIDSKRAELEQGKAQLLEARAALAAGQAEYDAGYSEYQTGLEQYNTAKAQLEAAEEQLTAAEQLYGEDNPAIIQQRVELETRKTALEQVKAVLDETETQLAAAKKQLDEGAAELAENEAAIAEGEAQLLVAQAQIDEGRIQYAAGVEQYNEGLAAYNEGRQQYLDGLTEYRDGLSKYNEGLAEFEKGQREYNEAFNTLAEKRAELGEGKLEYEKGVLELEDAKQKYADGLKEYNDGVETFNKEIADAEKELDDARQKIADAGEAEWYIFERGDNVGYAEYESNSKRIGQIAAIFPVFFLMVAALVCLTTMSRMVEEQRTQIGTLKALGYSNGSIMRHYMTYAISAAASGGVIGMLIGCYIFPWVIMYAYSMMYNINSSTFLLLPSNMLFSVGSMVIAIAATVFFSCNKALAESPAELMRPKAPKAGKRVLLERIGFIWNRMGFFGKVSGRNLFRYKRRMFMTIIGIAGCTALSLTGFGLKNSITDIVDLQYNYIYNYSGYIAIEDGLEQEELDVIYGELLNGNPEAIYTRALLKQYTVSGADTNVQCYIDAVEDTERFQSMVDMHERVSGKKITMGSGAVATEKLAKLLGIKAGDSITIKISDGETAQVTVDAITEHYASHYLYMSEQLYYDTFGYKPEYNMVYFENGISSDDAAVDAFSEKLLATDGVLAVMMNSGASNSFSETVKIMDLVIIVLIVSAGALAFVALYNLTNVNITERIREIATLKVLGFYDREVSSYVFRENVILSVMGAAAGLLLGTALCQFVITTAEIDEVMFGRSIHLPSYLWAFLLTIVFSLIVNFCMTGLLKKISMVESLKSVE